jgi:hypothetical protein
MLAVLRLHQVNFGPSLSGIRGAVYGRRFLGFELNCNTRVCVKEMQPIKAVLEGNGNLSPGLSAVHSAEDSIRWFIDQ